ncbi:MAG: TetR/AcrR family transcriptional regulator, partial [Gammaproteobacteria bacterium]|nr:TetR/AcrR family transcriptional regulator [Gammaproteobacteria bacterium]MBU1833469.1 TetR/AcrR family transcriptional regulator [Gammaproteobacteria bacterium]
MQKIEQNNTSGRTYGGESAAERLSRQRQTFMDAGLELFGTVGYRATTVRTLCKQAGLTDRYFYKTFSDTEDLLAAVYTESLDQIQAEVVAAINTAANQQLTAGQIDAGLEAFFSAFENSRMARVCWLEVLGVSPRIDA